MDVLTPKGLESLRQEKRAVELFLGSYGDFSYVETPKDQYADIDGFITKKDVIISGVEVKCRNMSIKELSEKFDNKWLVTKDKIDRCVNICTSLRIDFRGFLYLVPDDLLLIVPIWNNATLSYGTSMSAEFTETQETINGGKVVRLNAYIDVSNAKAVTQVS